MMSLRQGHPVIAEEGAWPSALSCTLRAMRAAGGALLHSRHGG